jgi:23S rRNA pseudouridine2605 synthase
VEKGSKRRPPVAWASTPEPQCCDTSHLPWQYQDAQTRVTDSRKIELARALSKLGYCSRSQAGRLIRAGRVRLNGAMRRDPETPVHLERDRIEVDGAIVSARRMYYLMVNKPRGVVTTASDEKGRKTVYALLGAGLPWLAPVGRLDMASEGLLLLTNDSEWAARISDPGAHLDKAYHVQIGTIAGEALVEQFRQGVRSDGELLRAKRVRVFRTGERNSWLEIVLDEGKNRHIRRMLDQVGIEVLRLVRVALGPLALGQLAKGAFRALAESEKLALDQAVKISGACAGRPSRQRRR